MASFFFYLIVVIVSLLIGAIATFLIWGLFALMKNAYVLRGVPKNRKKLTEYLKENKEKYKNPGLSTENEKEVYKENERRRDAKFREFEKLRRDELNARINPEKPRAGESKPNNNGAPRSKQLQRQNLLQNKPGPSDRENKPRVAKPKPIVKLDD